MFISISFSPCSSLAAKAPPKRVFLKVLLPVARFTITTSTKLIPLFVMESIILPRPAVAANMNRLITLISSTKAPARNSRKNGVKNKKIIGESGPDCSITCSSACSNVIALVSVEVEGFGVIVITIIVGVTVVSLVTEGSIVDVTDGFVVGAIVEVAVVVGL